MIIAFKDWGLERLELSVRSIHGSLEGIHHEVVIADYGSQDTDSVAASAQRAGAIHEIVATDGEWSKSRALNAGVRASSGEIILASDADMLFTPRALSRVVDLLDVHPQQIVILQCRDLPKGYSHEVLEQERVDWDRLASIGQVRARWGMGGLVGIRREIWEALRGWDERMHTYGGEDIDFAKRAQMYGARINWLDEPDVAMYHIWHPSNRASAGRSAKVTAAIDENRRICTSDGTFARNRVHHRYLPRRIRPLVSVVIHSDTENEQLGKTLCSILVQTADSLEVIVTGTSESPIADPRVRAVETEHVEPRGTFVTAARSGEIWSEARLEALLDLWEPGTGLISDRVAQRLVDEDGVEISTLSPVASPLPEALSTLVRAALLDPGEPVSARSWPRLVQGVACSGAGWITTGTAARLVTATLMTEEPLAVAREVEGRSLTSALMRCALPVPAFPAGSLAALGGIAEAVLQGGPLTLDVVVPKTVDIEDLPVLTHPSHRWAELSISTGDGAFLTRLLRWAGTDPAFAVSARRELVDRGASVTLRSITSGTLDLDHWRKDTGPAALAANAEEIHGTPEHPGTWVAVDASQADPAPIEAALRALPSATVVLNRRITADEATRHWLLVRFRGGTLETPLVLAASMDLDAPVYIIQLPQRVMAS